MKAPGQEMSRGGCGGTAEASKEHRHIGHEGMEKATQRSKRGAMGTKEKIGEEALASKGSRRGWHDEGQVEGQREKGGDNRYGALELQFFTEDSHTLGLPGQPPALGEQFNCGVLKNPGDPHVLWR